MFNTDKPIKSSKDDLLGRSEFAYQLAEAILDLSRQDSFVVGLYGKWGSGKTSVLNLTEEELIKLSRKEDEPHITLIRFNPWGYTDGNQLVQQFFSALSNELETDNTDEKKKAVGEALEKYSFALDYLKLIPVVGQYLAFLPELASKIGAGMKENALAKENNVQYQKRKVSDALSAYEGKIVIFIDDIDRLPNDQIRMIFQLVNSVADFPNIIYVLSFDKDIVARALNEVQNCEGSEYLGKIVQVPFTLPAIANEKLQYFLTEQLKRFLPEEDSDLYDGLHWAFIEEKCIFPFVHSLRDIYRFINVLEFKYTPIEADINPLDFIGITAIEVFNTALYEWIKANKGLLTSPEDPIVGLESSNREENKSVWTKNFGKLFAIAPETVIEMISCLFPKFANLIDHPYESTSDQDQRRTYRVGHPDRFDRYFTLSIENQLISQSSVESSLFRFSKEEYANYIQDLLEAKLLRDYLKEVRDSIEKIPESRLQVLICGLYSFLKLIPSEKPDSFFDYTTQSICQLVIRMLLQKITNQEKRADLFIELLSQSPIEDVVACATLICDMEYAQGRLGSSKTKEPEIVLSEDNLVKIENAFCARLKYLPTTYNILESPNFAWAFFLWSTLDSENCLNYMKALLSANQNVLVFVAKLAHLYFSSDGVGWSFEQEKDFHGLLTTEYVIGVIYSALTDKSFFNMPENLQIRIAAFILFVSEPQISHSGVPEKKALQWLRKQRIKNSVAE